MLQQLSFLSVCDRLDATGQLRCGSYGNLTYLFSTKLKLKPQWNDLFLKTTSDFSLGPTLEPEEVVNKLMKGILTEQKMIFVPSSISFLTVLER